MSLQRPFIAFSRHAMLGLVVAFALQFSTGSLSGAEEARQTNGFRFLSLTGPASEGADELAARFVDVAAGLQWLDQTPFSIRRPVALTGMDVAREGQFFPTELPNLSVGAPAARLHLLHTTLGEAKEGTPLAQVVFHYADGSQERVRLGYGVHVREWVRNRGENKSDLADPQSAVAWKQGGEEENRPQLRVFHSALDNPRPGESIASISIQSLFSPATPVVFALTLEDKPPTKPAARFPTGDKMLGDLRENRESAYRGELLVRITNAASSSPLTNATALLAVTDDTKTFYFGEVAAGSDGLCRLPYPVQHAVGITLLVRAADRVPVVIAESLTTRSSFSKEFTATLEPGIRVGGVVKSPDGQPLPGAEVLIHRVEKTGSREYRRTDFAAALTGADGRWSSACLPAGFSNFQFQVSHPEYRPAVYLMPGQSDVAMGVPAPVRPPGPVEVNVGGGRLIENLGGLQVPPPPPPSGPVVRQRIITSRTSPRTLEVTSNALVTSAAEFTLQPAIRIEGTLVGHDGKPVPSAEMFFQRQNPSYERRRLRTDANGKFRLVTPDSGDGALIVVREGATPKFQYLNIETGLPPLEIRLEAARTMRGRVIDRQQRPVPGARVRLDDWQGVADLLAFQTLTDNDGRFAWTGAPPDQVTFHLSKTNCYTTRHSTSAGANEMTLFLNRMPGISGRVLDAETRQPIDLFTLIRGRKYSQNETQIHWERYDTPRGRGGEYFIRLDEYYFQPEARLMVEAPGYVPGVSPGFTSSGTHTHDFLLKKGIGLSGEVRLPNGQPAVGATVVLISRSDYGYMDVAGQLRSGGNYGDFGRTDSQGRFDFSPKLEMEGVIAAHDDGFAEIKVSAAATNAQLTLKPWAKVHGIMKVGEQNEPERWPVIQAHQDAYNPNAGRSSFLNIYLKAEPDSEGRFVIDKVPPGKRRIDVEYRLRERNYGEVPFSHGRPIVLKEGETNEVLIGGSGRKLVGRVKVTGGDVTDVDWRRDTHKLMSAGSFAAMQSPPGAVASILGNIFGGPRQVAADPRTYILLFESNGTFRIDHVPPGKYTLVLNVTDPDEEYYNRRPIGNAQREVEVPEVDGSKVNEPFDIGTVDLAITPKLRIGKAVPDFEARTFDDKPVKLSEHRGKYVLMFFWASYSGLGSYDLNVLRELQNSYGAQGRLVVMGLNLDASLDAARNFARTQNMTWNQVYLGEWGKTSVPATFGVDSFPTGLLVDAEGKLVARQLRGSGLRNAVRNALD